MKKKDIYSIRKSKVGAVSAKIAAVTFLTLATGVALNSAQAQAADEAAITNQEENYSVSDEQIKDLENKIEDKKSEITEAEKNAAEKTKEIEKNQEEVTQKEAEKNQKKSEVEDLEKKIKKADEVTPEKIQSVKDAITNKESEVKDKENEKNNADKDVEAKEDTKKDIDKKVSDKEQEVSDAKTQKDAAKSDVDNKEKELNPQKVLDLENEKTKSEQELVNKEKEITSKEQDVNNATTAVENAKEADRNRQKSIDDAKAQLAQKEAEQKNKEKAEKEKTNEVEKLQKELEDAFPYPTDFKSTPEWLAAFKDLLDIRAEENPNKYPEYQNIEYPKKEEYPPHPNMDDYRNSEGTVDYEEYDKAVEQRDKEVARIDAEYKKALEEYNRAVEKRDAEYNKAVEEYNTKTDEWIVDNRARKQKAYEKAADLDESAQKAYDNYVNEILNKIPTNENEEKLDPNNLPEEVLLEINEYFVTLVNSLRTQLGLSEATLNKNDISFAKEVAATVVRDNYLEMKHYGKGVNEVADKRGLKRSADLGVMTTSQYYENLMSSTKIGKNVTKSELYKEIAKFTAGFFYEGYQGYGHALALTSTSNIGVAFSLVEGNARGVTSYDENWNEVPLNTLKWHVLSVSPNLVDDGTFDNIYGATSTSNVAKKIYVTREEVQHKLDAAMKELKTAEDELKLATSEVDKAKEDVENKENVALKTPAAEKNLEQEKENLRNLQAQKVKIEERIKDLTKSLEDAKKEEKDKQDQLTKLKQTLHEKENTLKSKEDELTQLKSDAKTAEKELDDAKKNAEKKNAELEKVKDEVTKLKTELKELEDLANSRSKLEKDLTDAKKVLKDAEDDLKSKQDELSANQTSYTNLLKEIERLKQELKALEDDYKNKLKIYTKERLPKPVQFDPKDELPTVEIKESDEFVDIDFKIVEQDDPTLEKGKRVVKVAGQKGRKQIKTTIAKLGNDILDTKVDEKVLVDPVDEIVLVGTKVERTSKHVEVRTEKLSYKTITRENASLKDGERKVIQKGVEGSQKVVRDDIYEGEKLVETGREYIAEKIDPIDEIIEVGTKKVNPPQNPTDPKDGGENPKDDRQNPKNPKDPKDSGENPTDPKDGGENPIGPKGDGKNPIDKGQAPKDNNPIDSKDEDKVLETAKGEKGASTITKANKALPKTNAVNSTALAGTGLITVAAVVARRKNNN